MILYFSGTGNSAYVAKRIGKAIGDEVILEHGGRPLVYEVYQTLTVTPQDDSVLLSDGTGQLTLITCSSAVEPTHRFVVQARLKSEE